MLSDAGYGIVMAVACFIILKKFSLEGMTYKMIKMFFLCGLSTVFWGALFGGWFGDFFQVAAKVIFNKEITIEPIWFNPIEDPTRMLIWSLVFGVIHLFLGMGIHAAMLIEKSHLEKCSVRCLLVVYGDTGWCDVAGRRQHKRNSGETGHVHHSRRSNDTDSDGRKRQERHRKDNRRSQFAVQYHELCFRHTVIFQTSGTGLATGVIASVVNTMGSLAGGGIWGTIVLLIVFVAGHSFNMAINALGAFVHSSRLQYIEFFGKFYEDGGEEFEPLKKNTKYVRLMNDTDGGRK